MTILAYQPPCIVTGQVSANDQCLGFYASCMDNFYPMPLVLSETEQFTIQKPLDLPPNIPEGICPHCWLSGTVQTHRNLGNGGCGIITSSAIRCLICGTVVVGEEKIACRNAQCPHR